VSFSIAKRGDTVVVDVEGQLVVGNRQELKQAVLEEVERGERKFVVDFSRTGYIDSAGLGILVSVSKKVRESGGELRLANLNDDLRTLFELTKLDVLFQFVEPEGSVGAAGAAGGAPPSSSSPPRPRPGGAGELGASA
jgi:anti-sigma B factor antagonist